MSTDELCLGSLTRVSVEEKERPASLSLELLPPLALSALFVMLHSSQQHAPPGVQPNLDTSHSSSASHPSPFIPYASAKHRVTRGRYITSNDPRGYIPVYEYPLNNQWVMMDVDDGYILWTGIWKALGNAKADIVKMIESQPELESQLRRVRGGYLKIQGTWMPYEVALRLARRVAWNIREDLIPLFGPTFPSTCLSPDQPGYGQILDNAGRKRRRAPGQSTAIARAAIKEQQASNAAVSGGSLALRRSSSSGYPAGYQYADQQAYVSPTSEQRLFSQSSSSQGSFTLHHPYPAAPESPSHYTHGPPPASRGSYESYTFPHRASEPSLRTPRSPLRERRASDSRQRYSPYPPPSSSHSHSSVHSYTPPAIGGGFNLPPISSMNFDRQLPHSSSRRPSTAGGRVFQQPSLPPIESLSEGQPPAMDATTVLQRLRVDDTPRQHSELSTDPTTMPPPPAPPLGIAAAIARGERPSEQYMNTRRRSSSAPPIHPLPLFRVSGSEDDIATPMQGGHRLLPSFRPAHHHHQHTLSGDGNDYDHYEQAHHVSHAPSSFRFGASSTLGRPFEQSAPRAHNSVPTARGPSSSSSSLWNSRSQYSPAPSSIVTADHSPVSPISSSPWSPMEVITISGAAPTIGHSRAGPSIAPVNTYPRYQRSFADIGGGPQHSEMSSPSDHSSTYGDEPPAQYAWREPQRHGQEEYFASRPRTPPSAPESHARHTQHSPDLRYHHPDAGSTYTDPRHEGFIHQTRPHESGIESRHEFVTSSPPKVRSEDLAPRRAPIRPW